VRKREERDIERCPTNGKGGTGETI